MKKFVQTSVRVFISHSFSEVDHIDGMDSFRRTIQSCCSEVENACEERSFGKVIILPYFEGQSVGSRLPKLIRDQISASDIVLVDLTGRTANTAYELGYAHSLGKELIVFQTKDLRVLPLPSNIADLLVGVFPTLDSVRKGVVDRLQELVFKICADERISTRRSSARCFWFDKDVKDIHVVCGPEPEKTRFANTDADDFLFVDNFDDRDALFEITAFLSRAYPDAKIFRHTSANVPSDVLESNLVLIGGPLTNDVTKDMMTELAVACRYVDDDLAICFETKSGSFQAASKKDSSGMLIEDAGYFGRFRNPFLRDHRIVMCQGCHTFGTLSACNLLSDSHQALENIKSIERKYEQALNSVNRLECLFTAKILRNRKTLPPSVNLEWLLLE